MFSIRTEGDAQDPMLVPMQLCRFNSGEDVVKSNSVVATATSKNLSIRAEGDG